MNPHTRLIVAGVLAVVACGIALAWRQWSMAALCAAVAFLVYAIGGHL